MSDDIPTRKVTIELPVSFLDEELPDTYPVALTIEEAARMAIQDGVRERRARQLFNKRVRRFVERATGEDNA